jgi:hypothetical protein
MSYIQYEIKEYHVNLSSFTTGTGVGNVRILATIECKAADGNRCLIWFYDERTRRVPVNSYNPDTITFGTYRPGSQYPWFIDILRNEKPVRCRIYPDNMDGSGIDTGFEPTGEGEQAG